MNTRSVKLWTLLAVLALLLALPLTTLAAPGDQYEVVGAGTAAVNGLYTGQTNFAWGGARYTFVNGATTYYLCNDNAAAPTRWLITSSEMDCQYGAGYYVNSSSSLPPPETGWGVYYFGSSPAPTVVEAVKGAKISKSVTTAFRLVQPAAHATCGMCKTWRRDRPATLLSPRKSAAARQKARSTTRRKSPPARAGKRAARLLQ